MLAGCLLCLPNTATPTSLPAKLRKVGVSLNEQVHQQTSAECSLQSTGRKHKLTAHSHIHSILCAFLESSAYHIPVSKSHFEAYFFILVFSYPIIVIKSTIRKSCLGKKEKTSVGLEDGHAHNRRRPSRAAEGSVNAQGEGSYPLDPRSVLPRMAATTQTQLVKFKSLHQTEQFLV